MVLRTVTSCSSKGALRPSSNLPSTSISSSLTLLVVKKYVNFFSCHTRYVSPLYPLNGMLVIEYVLAYPFNAENVSDVFAPALILYFWIALMPLIVFDAFFRR